MAIATTLAALYEHNLWANRMIVEECAKMTDEQLDATAPGVYGTIRDTLKHIFGAEERYVAQLRNLPRPATSREREPFTGFDDLKSACESSGQALIGVANEASPDDILRGTMRDGARFEMPVIVALIQAINHGTEHRAHINTMRVYLGLEPVGVDGWAYADAHKMIQLTPPPAEANV
jgi:uncharacterized damage-inducible protein DinB